MMAKSFTGRGEDFVMNSYLLTQSFWRDSAFSARIHDPIVIFERVNGLQNGADATHVAVNLCIAQEFSR